MRALGADRIDFRIAFDLVVPPQQVVGGHLHPVAPENVLFEGAGELHRILGLVEGHRKSIDQVAFPLAAVGVVVEQVIEDQAGHPCMGAVKVREWIVAFRILLVSAVPSPAQLADLPADGLFALHRARNIAGAGLAADGNGGSF
jgi:hypothetical protein